ncbi:MAG: MarC family protein [Odoribacter splanchnicus]
MDLHLSIKEIFTAFMVLFAVIDITGSTPIIINLNATGKQVQAGKAALISYAVMITFLLQGCPVATFQCRHFFFAIAGALVLLVLAVEMIFSVEIFRNDGPAGECNYCACCLSSDCRGRDIDNDAFSAGRMSSLQPRSWPFHSICFWFIWYSAMLIWWNAF